jgi:NAD(P)-dependent dehydrogenase (short-subunit alcohol dehydrogenase family)
VKELEGMVAIVTGAASGLGRASALAMARSGARVVLSDVDAPGLDQSVSLIAAEGFSSDARLADVRVRAEMFRLVEEVESIHGGLDVMHANAGVERYEALETMAEGDLDLLLDVDLKGALLCAQAAIPAMKKRGGGSIIFTSSIQATHSLPGCVVYAAAKAGLIAAARTLALEVGAANIRVNAISPGTIDTPMLHRDLADLGVPEQEDVLRRVSEANTLRRIGRPDEVGEAIVFLASNRSSYITATNLVIDGGYSAIKTF